MDVNLLKAAALTFAVFGWVFVLLWGFFGSPLPESVRNWRARRRLGKELFDQCVERRRMEVNMTARAYARGEVEFSMLELEDREAITSVIGKKESNGGV